jgi:hypothetical protein
MVEVTDAEKKKAMSEYKLSEEDINKLFALCDMKYKPTHLNTPAKIKTIIEQNQKDKPYEAYFVALINGEDNEIYYIIYLPTAYNRWLPEGMKFEVQDGLYFCIPATEGNFGDYYSFESKLAILKGVEEDKKREQEQQKLFTEKAEWSAKNKFKGVFLLQYDGNFSNYDKNDDELIRVVSVFGPVNQIFTEADRLILEEKYQSSIWKLKNSNFNENMNEAQAIKYLMEVKGYDRFSINNNYSYTIPIRMSKSDADEMKKIDAELAKNQQEINKLYKEIVEDKLTEKSSMRQKAMTDIFAGKSAINNPTTVEIIDISTSDKYYTENKKFIGKIGTVEATLIENGDGTYYGTIQFPDEKYSTIFYKIKVKIIE